MGLAAQEALKQPTWCRLQLEQFPLLAARAHPTAPENVLFTYKTHAARAALGGGATRGADEVSGEPNSMKGGLMGTVSATAARHSGDSGAAVVSHAAGAPRAVEGPSSGLGSKARVTPGLLKVTAGVGATSFSRRR